MASVDTDDLPHLHRFVTGLRRDYQAVRNGLTLSHSSGVARQDHGTALSGFLPRGWDHLVASDGTTRRVVWWGLIASGIRSVHVMRRGGSVDGVSGGLGG
jgi:hypothetical protein